MLEKLVDYFLTSPRRMVTLGRALISTSGFVAVAGVAGWMVKRVSSVVEQRLPIGAVPRTLADTYPGLWTWWIPETVLGIAVVLLLVGVGCWFVVAGNRLQRMYR